MNNKNHYMNILTNTLSLMRNEKIITQEDVKQTYDEILRRVNSKSRPKPIVKAVDNKQYRKVYSGVKQVISNNNKPSTIAEQKKAVLQANPEKVKKDFFECVKAITLKGAC